MDENPKGEFLKFKLRTKSIISGMDLAIQGMCAGEKVSVIIPPHLSFDDPEMQFRWSQEKPRPVPKGTILRYEIRLESIEGGSRSVSTGTTVALGMLLFAVLGII